MSIPTISYPLISMDIHGIVESLNPLPDPIRLVTATGEPTSCMVGPGFVESPNLSRDPLRPGTTTGANELSVTSCMGPGFVDLSNC